MFENWIPNRKFNVSVGFEQKSKVRFQFGTEEWKSATSKALFRGGKISLSAIKIAEQVENKLGIELFPCVTKIATKGWDLAGGTLAFSMCSKDGETFYFDHRARRYHAKKAELELYVDEFQNSIITIS